MEKALSDWARRLKLPPADNVWWPSEGDQLKALTALLYETFASSQGRQWSQPVQLLFIVLRLRDRGIVLEDAALDRLEDEIAKRRVPGNHVHVDAALVKKVFRFWARNLADIGRAVRTGDPSHLPNARQLDHRLDDLGAKVWESSFTQEERAPMVVTFGKMRNVLRRAPTPEQAMLELAGPYTIETEARWVGHVDGRPRTDHGDPREVKFTAQIRSALLAQERGQVTAFQDFYLCFAAFLDVVEAIPDPGHPLRRQYRELIELYNLTHDAKMTTLHRPPWLAYGHERAMGRQLAGVSSSMSASARMAELSSSVGSWLSPDGPKTSRTSRGSNIS